MKAIIGFIILFTRLQEVYSSDNCHLQLLKECGKKVDAYENANVGAQGQQFIQVQCTLAQVNDLSRPSIVFSLEFGTTKRRKPSESIVVER